jgi:hypothetical protein
MEGKVVEMEIRVHGKPVREYLHKGTTWIEGRKSTDFTLHFRNRTSRRILIVPSVDGLSIMDGETATYDSGGYILDAYEHIDVPGWHLDGASVAKFVFGKKGKSYAATKDKPKDVGVIGVAAFFEREVRFSRLLRSSGLGQSRGMGPAIQSFTCSHLAPQGDSRAQLDSMVSDSAQTTCKADPVEGTSRDAVYFNQPVSQELGTEFGERTDFATVTVPFEKASDKPDEKLSIRYDSRRNLRRRGVNLNQKPKVAHEPNAFPGEEGCKPPPGWQG